MSKLTRVVLSAIFSLCIFGAAYAGTVGSTLDVSTNVVAACSVTTSPVVIPDYDSTASVVGTGSIDVNCTSGAAYNIALDGGAYFLPSPQRRLSDDGTNFLNYSLWTDDTFTEMWGDAGFGDTTPYPTVADVGTGIVQPHPVPGAVPLGQTVPFGAYSDIVNVTIHY